MKCFLSQLSWSWCLSTAIRAVTLTAGGGGACVLCYPLRRHPDPVLVFAKATAGVWNEDIQVHFMEETSSEPRSKWEGEDEAQTPLKLLQ